MRASERTLKVRLKSLTNELAVYKRKAIHSEHGGNSATKSSYRQNSGRAANTSRGSVGSFTRERYAVCVNGCLNSYQCDEV